MARSEPMEPNPTPTPNKYRKFIVPILVLAAVVFTIFQLAENRSYFVPLPVELQLAILIVCTGIVARVLEVLSQYVKIDLTQYRDQAAAALAGVIVTIIEAYLHMIPASYDQITATVLHLIVLILGALGVIKFLSERGAPGFIEG